MDKWLKSVAKANTDETMDRDLEGWGVCNIHSYRSLFKASTNGINSETIKMIIRIATKQNSYDRLKDGFKTMDETLLDKPLVQQAKSYFLTKCCAHTGDKKTAKFPTVKIPTTMCDIAAMEFVRTNIAPEKLFDQVWAVSLWMGDQARAHNKKTVEEAWDGYQKSRRTGNEVEFNETIYIQMSKDKIVAMLPNGEYYSKALSFENIKDYADQVKKLAVLTASEVEVETVEMVSASAWIESTPEFARFKQIDTLSTRHKLFKIIDEALQNVYLEATSIDVAKVREESDKMSSFLSTLPPAIKEKYEAEFILKTNNVLENFEGEMELLEESEEEGESEESEGEEGTDKMFNEEMAKVEVSSKAMKKMITEAVNSMVTEDLNDPEELFALVMGSMTSHFASMSAGYLTAPPEDRARFVTAGAIALKALDVGLDEITDWETKLATAKAEKLTTSS